MDIFPIFHATEQAVETVAHTTSDTGVIGLLGINWKIFLAQLINFSIIVFILWKWVFTPVTKALENRTKKIENSLAEAQAIKKQFAELESHKANEEKRARVEYQKVLASAEKLAQEQKQEILREARAQTEKLQAESNSRIEADRQKAMSELRAEVAEIVVAAAEKIISEKLDKKKDAELIKMSLKNIVSKRP